MKNLVLSTLIAAGASLAAGCIISGDDGTTTGRGGIEASWDLKSVDAQGNTIQAGCPAGATTAEVFALPLGADPSAAFSDKYDCIDPSGRLADLEAGVYTSWVRFTDTSGAMLFAESASQQVTVGAGNVIPVGFDVFIDHGFFIVGWNLTGAANRCSAVQNNGVSILATIGGGATGFETLVDCTEGEGVPTISEPIPSSLTGTARYTVAVSLLRSNGATPPVLQSIGDAPVQANKSLDYGNELENLGVLNIQVR